MNYNIASVTIELECKWDNIREIHVYNDALIQLLFAFDIRLSVPLDFTYNFHSLQVMFLYTVHGGSAVITDLTIGIARNEYEETNVLL